MNAISHLNQNSLFGFSNCLSIHPFICNRPLSVHLPHGHVNVEDVEHFQRHEGFTSEGPSPPPTTCKT